MPGIGLDSTDITRAKVSIRKDPFTGEDESVLIELEQHTIPSASKFYIQLEEIPRSEDPSTVLIYLTDTLAEDVDISEVLIDISHGSWWEVGDVWLVDNEQMLITGKAGNTITVTRGYGGTSPATHTNGTRFRKLTTWTEVYTAPSAGEYQVHYGTAEVPYHKGQVRFNEADANKVVWVTYYGTGFGNLAEHLNDIQERIAVYTAGDNLISYADTERSTISTTYTKIKEIVVGKAGTLRIKFDLRRDVSADENVYGRIYRNGVAIGTERVMSSTTYATYSEDIAGWAPGDLCQLYYKRKIDPDVSAAWIRNFRIYTKEKTLHPLVTLN